MVSFYFSTLLLFAFLCLYYPLNSVAHPLNKLCSILYHLWLVPQGEGMPQHGPAVIPPSPTSHHTPIEHILIPLYLFIITTPASPSHISEQLPKQRPSSSQNREGKVINTTEPMLPVPHTQPKQLLQNPSDSVSKLHLFKAKTKAPCTGPSSAI